MSQASLRNKANIVTPNGSELMVLRELTALTPAYTWDTAFSAPIIIDSSFENAVAEESLVIEGGEELKFDGTITRTFNVTFGQQDGASKQFLNKDCLGKYYSVLKQNYKVKVDGKWQYDFYGVAKFSANFTKPAKGFEVERTMQILSNEMAMTVSMGDYNTAMGATEALSCTSFVLATGEAYKLYEQAGA